jgi:hypothetical protein
LNTCAGVVPVTIMKEDEISYKNECPHKDIITQKVEECLKECIGCPIAV